MDDTAALRQWIDDLQSGMYINCVYCGHRYGPEDEVPASMADVLKEHVETCPKHPMSELKQDIEGLRDIIQTIWVASIKARADAAVVADTEYSMEFVVNSILSTLYEYEQLRKANDHE